MIECNDYVLLETEEEYYDFFQIDYGDVLFIKPKEPGPEKMPEKFPAVMKFEYWEERDFRSNKYHCYKKYEKGIKREIKKEIRKRKKELKRVKKVLKRG